MAFDVQVFHSIEEIGPEAWDQLSAGQPLASYRWCRFGETVLQDCPPTYIVLSRSGEPVARAAIWLKRQEWLPITSAFIRAGADQLLKHRPLFACETPFVCLPGLILPVGPERIAALETIAAHAHALAKKAKAFCALFSYVDQADAVACPWPKPYSAVSYADEETYMDVSWPDFERYRSQLAKSTRRNMRLHGNEAAQMGIAINAQPGPVSIDEAVRLIQNVEAFHKFGHRPWARAMLENAPMVDTIWISAHMGDRLVGCCSLLGDDHVLTATLLGLDYSNPKWIYIYYQLMYAVVRYSIESGCKGLYGGGGAYELKRRLGFRKLPDDYLTIAATGRFSDWLLRGLVRLMDRPASSQQGGAEQVIDE
jgi:predicted N-acyltransferase